MSWSDTIISVHTSVTNAVSHGGRLKSNRYFVWQEDDAADFSANNKHAEKAVHGSTDLFSKTEFDGWIEDIEAAFNACELIAWSRNSTQFEEETGFWHTEWTWTVYG